MQQQREADAPKRLKPATIRLCQAVAAGIASLASFFGGICFSLLGSIETWPWYAGLILALVVILVLVLPPYTTWKLEQHQPLSHAERQLREELVALRELMTHHNEAVFGAKLEQLAAKLQVEKRPDHRLTLYAPGPHESFHAIGRYSYDCDLRLIRTRLFPRGAGVLQQAWKNGTALIEDLPCPNTQAADWLCKQISEMKLSLDRASQMRMKPRSYGAVRIEMGRTRALLVLEHTGPKLAVYQRLHSAAGPSQKRATDEIMRTLVLIEPSLGELSYGKDMGY